MRTCARSALPPPPALRGPSPGSLPLSPPLVTCCPAAQRGAGAAVPSPSRAAPSSPPDSAPPPPPLRSPGSPGAHRGTGVGGREGRRGRARAGRTGRKEGSREGREETCGRRGECEERTEGRRRALGLCPSWAPGERGEPVGAVEHLQHSPGSGCAGGSSLGDPGTPAAQGPRLGVSTAPALEWSGGVRARPVGYGAGGETPAREDEGSSPGCPPPPRLKGLGDCGVRGPNGEECGSGYLLRGEASPGPGKVVERLGGGDARAPGAVPRLGAAVGGMGGRGTRCNALISSVPPRAFAPPGPERFGAKQMCVLGGRGGGGGVCPSSPSSSRRFRSVEPFPAERRRDNPDLPFHLFGRGVSREEKPPPHPLPGALPTASGLHPFPPRRPRDDHRAGGKLVSLTAGSATARRGWMRLAGLRRCGAAGERDKRPRG